MQAWKGNPRKRRIRAVDLFCGAGGLTYGLAKAGVDVKLGVDIDPACEFPYTANNGALFLLKSVEDLQARDLQKAFGRSGLRLLAGCPPCQTFSTYNQKAASTDKRWWLLRHFSRLVQEAAPDLVTTENVRRLQDQDVFNEFVATLKASQYHVTYDVVNCEDYGVPQHRHRLVLLASKLGPIRLLAPSEIGRSRRTVKEAIGDMPSLEAGSVDSADPLHQASTLSPTNRLRIAASRPGGTWRDWEENLIADCHKRTTGKTYPSVYGRMCWEEPAPTITTEFFAFGSGRFGHPQQQRAISLREGAILQGFPEGYKFSPPEEPIYKKKVGRLIGNAVPVGLSEVIGLSIMSHIAGLRMGKGNADAGERSCG